MTLLADKPTTGATVRADANIAANLRAIEQSQPELVYLLAIAPPDVEWLFGRDASLTARDARGRWLAGCSLPRRAAREMLRKLDVHGSIACFLAPPHAAHIAVALELMRPEQAVVALVPSLADLSSMLRCENFADAIGAHRLWFVTGETWPAQLAGLYESQAGLAPPGQFIRVPMTADDVVEPLIAQAQRVISQVTIRRSELIRSIRTRPWRRPAQRRLCVVAPTRFRLWNDVGHALVTAAEDAARAGDDLAWTLYDADDPACGSPLALATVARECGAILTANTSRGDLPGLLPEEMPWITWVTSPRVPSFSAAGPHDRLLLADPSEIERARRNGWPEARLAVATWNARAPEPTPATGALSIIADTRPLDAPEDLHDYSSHTLLWESIRDELLRNPLAVRDEDVHAYLASRMGKMNIGADGFPTQRFVDQLIVPAYQQGVARAMLRENHAVELHGEGWNRIPEFAPHAHGPVGSRAEFAAQLASSRILVHVWPTRHAHPIDFTGRPVIRLGSATPRAHEEHAAPLSGAILRRILVGI